MDIQSTQYQIKKLNEQIASVKAYSVKLSAYKANLNSSWSGPEVASFNRTIDDIGNRCRALELALEKLNGDILDAVEKVLAEKNASCVFSGDSHEVI